MSSEHPEQPPPSPRYASQCHRYSQLTVVDIHGMAEFTTSKKYNNESNYKGPQVYSILTRGPWGMCSYRGVPLYVHADG